MRTRIAALSRKMQLPCRRLRRPRRVLRHGPAAFCSAAMASRVSVSGMSGNASPGPATASVAATVPASIKDSASSRRAPRAFRRSREAAACRVLDVPANRLVAAWRIRRFAPVRPSIERHGASVPTGCISPCDPRYLRIAWHLDIGCRKLRSPRPCRTSTGRLSSSLSGVSSRRRGRRATNGRRQNTPGTKAAPEVNA